MIILKILAIILAALIFLILLVLLTNVGLKIKYKGSLKVYLRVWFISVDISRFSGRKKKARVEKLSDYLKAQGTAEADKSPAEKSSEKNKPTADKPTSIPSQAKKGSAVKTAAKSGEEKKAQSESTVEKPQGSIFDSLKQSTRDMEISDIIKLVTDLLKSFAKPFSAYAKVKIKSLKLTVGCPDAADTAILFGLANGAVSSLLAVADNFENVKIKDGGVGVYTDFTSGYSHAQLDIRLSIFVWQALICLIKPTQKYLASRNR